jgi:uncharacterized protein (TIGR03083 family)
VVRVRSGRRIRGGTNEAAVWNNETVDDGIDLRRRWPLVPELVHRELRSYVDAATERSALSLPTRCPPWTVLDITRHLAATFSRFNRLLEQSRAGDLSPPFPRDGLSEENLRAVAAFEGEPTKRLEAEVARLLDAATDDSELIAHQRGPITVGLQMRFALNELAIHHDDVAIAKGGRYRPSAQVVDALVPVWMEVLGPLRGNGDPWDEILRASGR